MVLPSFLSDAHDNDASPSHCQQHTSDPPNLTKSSLLKVISVHDEIPIHVCGVKRSCSFTGYDFSSPPNISNMGVTVEVKASTITYSCSSSSRNCGGDICADERGVAVPELKCRAWLASATSGVENSPRTSLPLPAMHLDPKVPSFSTYSYTWYMN